MYKMLYLSLKLMDLTQMYYRLLYFLYKLMEVMAKFGKLNRGN